MSEGQKWDNGKLDWHCLPLTVLTPLVGVFEAGIKKGYGRFNCLQPFSNPDQRFFSATMRHLEACQLDPLAIDEETGCYHAAQVAFNTLMRLYHAKKEASLQEELDREHQANCELDMAARELKKAMLDSIIRQLEEQGDD